MKNNTCPDRLAIIRNKLTQALVPTFLEVIDEGDQHIGHGKQGAGHFALRLSSPLFQNKPLLECHRLVYAALGNTMGTEIHALRIEIITP